MHARSNASKGLYHSTILRISAGGCYKSMGSNGTGSIVKKRNLFVLSIVLWRMECGCGIIRETNVEFV